jgi:hypothetical protein
VHRLSVFVASVALSCLCFGAVATVSPQVQFIIDATKQPSPPLRARGPFPGSAVPGHTTGLPVQLELFIPTGELQPDGTIMVDFIISNVGPAPITLPSSSDQNLAGTMMLTLWLTSEAAEDPFVDLRTGRPVKMVGVVETSAELRGQTNDLKSLHVLAPSESIRVHASSRVRLRPGTDALVAHAELIEVSHGASELIGTADSEALTKTLSSNLPAAFASGCPNLAGHYLLPGEDGGVRYTVRQKGCERVEIDKAATYLGKTSKVETQEFIVDGKPHGKLETVSRWLGDRLQIGPTTNHMYYGTDSARNLHMSDGRSYPQCDGPCDEVAQRTN